MQVSAASGSYESALAKGKSQKRVVNSTSKDTLQLEFQPFWLKRIFWAARSFEILLR